MKSRASQAVRALLACIIFMGLTGFTSSSMAAEAGGDYTLSRQYGTVVFSVLFQQTLNMKGRFDDYAGTLHLDVDNLANSTLTASVQMGSLNMADADVVETLVNSGSWFNASLFPEATFASTETVVTGDNEVDFNGNLSFMGMSKPWTLHVKFFGGTDGELGGSSVGILGTGSFNRVDFGLGEYRNMAADTVDIEVNVKFNRK
jgi:polyisoprenoid-binding protein YceI